MTHIRQETALEIRSFTQLQRVLVQFGVQRHDTLVGLRKFDLQAIELLLQTLDFRSKRICLAHDR